MERYPLLVNWKTTLLKWQYLPHGPTETALSLLKPHCFFVVVAELTS